MPPNRLNPQSTLMKPLVALAIPGMYLVYKYNQFKRQQQENRTRKVAEKELQHLNHKIDKLLAKLDEHETDTTITEEEECVVCLCAKASMQTYPCQHRVVCRKCFVKTIQVAVAQRCLPLRCVVCRTRILKLKQTITSDSTPASRTPPPRPSLPWQSRGASFAGNNKSSTPRGTPRGTPRQQRRREHVTKEMRPMIQAQMVQQLQAAAKESRNASSAQVISPKPKSKLTHSSTPSKHSQHNTTPSKLSQHSSSISTTKGKRCTRQ